MIVGCPTSVDVVCRRPSSTFASKDISSLTNVWIWTKLNRNDPSMVFFNNCSNIPVHCISRSHRLKIDFQDENFKSHEKMFLSEITRPRALIFGM